MLFSGPAHTDIPAVGRRAFNIQRQESIIHADSSSNELDCGAQRGSGWAIKLDSGRQLASPVCQGSLTPAQFHFTQLEVGLYDLDTGKKVGSGGLSDRSTFPGREITPTTLDLRFYYRGQNSTDLTWVGYRNACGHKSNGVKRPTLGLNVRIITRIRGMIGETGASTTLANIACPIELPANNA